MCGRFAQVIKHDQLKKLQDELKLRQTSDQLELHSTVAPTQTVGAIVAKAELRYLGFFRWGLIPSWMKGIPDKALINARSESILEKPSFKASFIRRRCLIPANGFYEWRTSDKQPFFIHAVDDNLIYMAGIYDLWTGGDGSYVPSLGIITTEANSLMQPIHHRMPLLIGTERWDAWLNPENQEPKLLQSLLVNGPDIKLSYYQVGKFVNSITNNNPQCMLPAEPAVMQEDIFNSVNE